MTTKQILLSGFGGQGILFSGKMLAYKGLIEEKYVSWLPRYGPEMRGGTASCRVIVSDDPVGSPIVSNPDILVAMNLPSLDRFEDSVQPGGIIVVDSSLVERAVKRTDVKVYAVPATRLSGENGFGNLANMILLGKLLKVLDEFNESLVLDTLKKVIPPKKMDMIDINMRAIRLGADF